MQIEELDLNTRNQIYNSTKKVIRKYQKGISSGKLTAEKFADNIFTNKILLDILDESIINQADFQNSYINYINSLMQKQNENFKNYMESKHNKTIIRSTVSLQILLKNILKNSDYSLNIPIQYLNKKDIEAIIKYIQTGEIDIGNEKIYKYVSDNYCFKSDNVKDVVKSSEFINLGSVIEECDFEYGFKGEGSVEVEVFNTVNKNSGDIIGKVALNNQGEELLKKALICGKDIKENEFEEIINTESTNY